MLATGADPAIQSSFSFKSLGGGMSQILLGKAGSAQLLKGRGRASEVGEGRRGLGFRMPSIIQAPNSANCKLLWADYSLLGSAGLELAKGANTAELAP